MQIIALQPSAPALWRRQDCASSESCSAIQNIFELSDGNATEMVMKAVEIGDLRLYR